MPTLPLIFVFTLFASRMRREIVTLGPRYLSKQQYAAIQLRLRRIQKTAREIAQTFPAAVFTGEERYLRRLRKIEDLE